ncbi:MAG TPA: esterase [Cyanobacteria bacterium UBA8803]|nr:esterase [Cyanobacteria bacterium UBA9273]HBL58288.1 esterase [Cyanobacteria bacterium UBA8803]
MSSLIQWMLLRLALLLSSVGFFLSCWIIVPAPTMQLLPLGVGVPELSPWLLVLNAIPLGIAMLQAIPLALQGMHYSLLQRLVLGASLVGLFLSVLPLVQLPATEQRLAAAMVDELGKDYTAGISNEVLSKMRSHPFILADAFRGITLSPVRYTSGIPFAAPFDYAPFDYAPFDYAPFDYAQGKPLSMDIYRPLKIGHYPALVIIYGGGWQSGTPQHHADFSRYIAAQGYTVFAIAYRHAPRYQFPAQLDDVRAALTFIQQHATEYETDLNRIALLGRSAGGHLAMLAAYQSDTLPIRAVINYYGPFNLAEGYRKPPKPDPLNVRAVLEAFLGGSPDAVPEQYAKASPVSYVKRSLPPTLLIHGSRDHIVQVDFARDMCQRLRAVGNTSVLLEIPWAEHAFDTIFPGISNQVALYYTERFLAWALR